MHFIDREQIGARLEWDERVQLIILTLLGAVVFAFLAMSITGVIASSVVERTPILARILPWAAPPAMFAITFMILSRKQLFKKIHWNALADFLLHGSISAFAGWVAAGISISAGLQYEKFYVPRELVPSVAIVTSGLIGGTLGVVQCLISRKFDQNSELPS